MNKDEISLGLKKQSEICSTTSLLYKDILNYSSDNFQICELVYKASKDRNFTNSLEIALIFISYFNFIALEGNEIANHFKSYGGNYLENDYSILTEKIKKICVEQENEIINWIKNTNLQTNETARSSVIFPAILSLNLNKINLVEIGSSAGLIMYMDNFSYRYTSEKGEFINKKSEPLITSKTDNLDNLQELISKRERLEIVRRIGCDLNTIDLNNQDNIKLLKSAIWDSPERLIRLEQSIKVFKENQINSPISNVDLDYTENLAENVLSLYDKNADIVIYSSVSTYQISDELYNKLINQIKQIKEKANCKIYFIEFEPPREKENLGITKDKGEPFLLKINNINENTTRIFAKAHFHGSSMTLI